MVAKKKDVMTYKDAVNIWAEFDSWTLGSAADLLLEKLPRVLGNGEALKRKEEIRRQALIEFVYGSFDISLPYVGSMVGDKEQIRIRPADLFEWAESKNIEVPKILSELVSREDLFSKLMGTKNIFDFQKACDEEGLKLPRSVHFAIKRLSDSQIKRCRSQALASYLWEQNPNRTKVSIARDDLISMIGCGGHPPPHNTILRWLKGLGPNDAAGRPRN